MEKFIEIDGKQVGFKTNGAIPLIYMSQFKRDLIKDILSMGVTQVNFDKNNESEQIQWVRDNIDFMMFYNIAWVYAKAYDKTIKAPVEWLEEFEVFPIINLVEPLQELLEATISVKKKTVKAAKTPK